MAFYRYRFKYADGPEKKWSIIDSFDEQDEVVEQLKSLPESCSDSEHFRGVDIERIEYPSVDWLLDETFKMSRKIKQLQKTYNEYLSIIENVMNVEGEKDDNKDEEV